MSKKKIVLRMDDQELIAAKVTRDEDDNLVLKLKLHPRLENLFRSDDLREANGMQFYRKLDPALEKIMQVCQQDLTNTYPSMAELTVSLTTYHFSPHTLLSNSQLNFQALRAVGIGEGIEIKVQGALTLGIIRAWLLVSRSFVAKVWQEFMYPCEMEATLTTREMVS